MQSLNGAEGNFCALGLVTEKRGIFCSYPIYDARRRIIGIAVIKKDVDSLDKDFNILPGYAFLISPEGIIFVSNKEEVIGKSLWPLDQEIRTRLKASRQFGGGSVNAFLELEPQQDDKIIIEGKRHLVTHHSVEPIGWEIVLLSAADEIAYYRVLGITIVLLFFSLTIGFFVIREKSLEAATRISATEGRFRVLFENVPSAIFIINRVTRKLLSVNNFMADWLGYKPGELLLLTLDDLRMNGEEAVTCRYRKRNGVLTHVEEMRREVNLSGQTADLIIAHDIDAHMKAEELLRTLSALDGLTGIANRRRFDEFLDQEWRRAMREGTEISLIVADIDFFKNYNDTYGHPAGDECLKRVAAAISDIFHRPGDIVARYGGEEFTVIMSGTDERGALALAKVVRASVEALGIPHTASAAAAVVTLSLGVVTVTPQKDTASDVLVAAADQALYQTKKKGRNRIEVYLKEAPS